jgi:glycine/D-amino acid oxidase-like deaminating enzyme/nitrite reductase/ring-hydroxylating ferredoxin subunit
MLKSDEGKTVSYWEASETLIDRRPAAPAEVDVCVVGGGIAGLTTAYLLCGAGRRVAVLDDGLIGGGETSRTTAHLTNAIDDRFYRIEQWHGEAKARLAAESHTRAIDEIQRIAQAERIDCDLIRLDGYLFEAEESEDDLEKEIVAAHRCGLTEVDWAPAPPVEGMTSERCLRFPNQGQFHILKYLSGLARSIESSGGVLVPHTRVVDWTGGDSPFVEIEGGAKLWAHSLVLATNYPLKSKMFAQLPAYRTYAIAIPIPPGSFPKALLWDTGDPYHYVRTQPDGDKDLLIVGGEDHRTGQENDGAERFERLAEWAGHHLGVGGEAVYRWSGQCLETHDGLAFLGSYSEDEPNVYLITGDSGMGMTHGTIGGMIVSDLILGRKNPWTDVYSPSRIATQSITEAVPELVSSTVPYKEWLTSGDVASENDILNGEGAVIRDGIKKIAVYRDKEGTLHRRSAVCTHMGCIVGFNNLEKTWDCPCHGSRFSALGQPINAPALAPLEKLTEE